MLVRPRPEPVSASALLQLMWLASPALPVGGFSYSEGLEAAVESGHITGEADAATCLRDQLHLSLARGDLAVCAQAFKAWQRNDLARIGELNDWVTTTRETAESRQQTQQMGRSLVEWLRNRAGTTDVRVDSLKALSPAPTWPVAFALAAVQTGAPRREALLSFGFGWAENMVQAALKAVPLGQSAGQRVLAALVDELPAAVDFAAGLLDSQRQAFTPMLAILSAQHETQYSRLFRS
jgi:urease accessory protein